MKACLDCKVLFAEDHDECPRCGGQIMVSVNEDGGER